MVFFTRSAPVRAALCSLLALASAVAQAPYGDHQSPIDIHRNVPVDRNAPRFSDTAAFSDPKNFKLKNTTGYHETNNRWASIRAYPDPASSATKIRFGDAPYTLLEFHFHTPAEHLVNGLLAEMEVHFVFQRDGAAPCTASQLMVIGQRIVASPVPNPELNKIFGPNVQLPTTYEPGIPLKDFVIDRVLHGLSKSFRYPGSLTAPADLSCPNPPGNVEDQLKSGHLPEVVSWVLLQDTISMSTEQIARFQALFPNGDARGPQDLKGRRVTRTQ